MPIEIKRGVSLQTRRITTGMSHELRTALASMRPGDSFTYPARTLAYRAAKQLGIRIKTQKLNGSGYGVERVE